MSPPPSPEAIADDVARLDLRFGTASPVLRAVRIAMVALSVLATLAFLVGGAALLAVERWVGAGFVLTALIPAALAVQLVSAWTLGRRGGWNALERAVFDRVPCAEGQIAATLNVLSGIRLPHRRVARLVFSPVRPVLVARGWNAVVVGGALTFVAALILWAAAGAAGAAPVVVLLLGPYGVFCLWWFALLAGRSTVAQELDYARFHELAPLHGRRRFGIELDDGRASVPVRPSEARSLDPPSRSAATSRGASDSLLVFEPYSDEVATLVAEIARYAAPETPTVLDDETDRLLQRLLRTAGHG